MLLSIMRKYVGALLMLTVSISQATTISFTATNLPDAIPGMDLWRYDYLVTGDFSAFEGFNLLFDPSLYQDLQNPPPMPSPSWTAYTIQPVSAQSADGILSESVTVNTSSVKSALSLQFVWRGAQGTRPGAQAFERFDSSFNIIETSSTIALIDYTLNVTNLNIPGGTVTSDTGNINCGVSCSQSFASGSEIVLTAKPTPSYYFKGWGGSCNGTATCKVTLDQSKAVTADFGGPVMQLTINKLGLGSGIVSSSPVGIDCGTNCSFAFDKNSVVTLTPLADSGWFFNGWSGVCHGKSATCTVTMDKAKDVTASFGSVRTDALLIDFKPYGLWIRHSSNGVWDRLHSLSPNLLAQSDLDGNGVSDVVFDFKPYGVWLWMNGKEWMPLLDEPLSSITSVNLEGNGPADLIVGYGNNKGMWKWSQIQNWTKFFVLSPKSTTAAYLDENDLQDLILDFPPNGLWLRLNDSNIEQSWIELDHYRSPSLTAVGDLDGNGHDDVVFSFGADGSWKWMNSSNWLKLHPMSPLSMVTADLDGNGQTDVAFNFGKNYGLWVFMNNRIWVQLHTLTPTSMTAAYLDNNNKQDLVIDFAPFGIWVYKNNLLWEKLIDGPKSIRIVATPE